MTSMQMPIQLRYVTLLVFLIAGLDIQCVKSPESAFYVSPEGNDDWSGLIGAPSLLGSDGPFRTLERAQRAVREMDKSNLHTLKVYLRGGIYRIDESLHLTANDGGSEDTRIVWSAYPGENPILSGSRQISGFSPVADYPVASRIDPRYIDEIVQIDLRAQGVDDFGDFSDQSGPGLELFFEGQRMQRARYPNEGYLRITEVPQAGDSLIHKGSWQWTRNGIAVGRHFGVLRIDDERLEHWAASDDIWMHGYFVWDWRDGFQRVAMIDGERRLVYAAGPHHPYGYHQDQPFYFFNVLEELDRPGEWVVDRDEGLLYFWPPADIESATVTVSLLNEPMVLLDSTAFLSVERLVFEESRSSPVVVRGGQRVTIAGNTIRNVGTTGIVVEGGTKHLVASNDVHDVGGGGIHAHGGERSDLLPGDHEVANNHIYRFSQLRKTGVPGIRVTGVKNRVAHNVLHDSPDAGIFFSGNDLLLEYNEIYNIAQESDDVGAFYIGRDYSMQGNVVQFNYVHDIAKPIHVGVMAVYLDDFTSGVTVHGNVFSKAGRCAFMGGGRRNTITSNVFVDCEPAVFLDARGKVRNVEYFDGRLTTLVDRMAAVGATEPPYSERYPFLVDLYDDDPAMPKYNVIRSNISIGGTFLGLYSGLPLSILDLSDNSIAGGILLQTSPETGVETANFHRATSSDTSVVAELESLGNRIVSIPDSVFNLDSGVLELDPAHAIWPEGFEAADMDSVGLVLDEFRTSIP